MMISLTTSAEILPEDTPLEVWLLRDDPSFHLWQGEDGAFRVAETGAGEDAALALMVLGQDERPQDARMLAEAWAGIDRNGHPIEVGNYFAESVLPGLLDTFNRKHRAGVEPMTYLAGLICCSAFDIALHDAYGKLLKKDVYSTYNAEFMNDDLSAYLEPADDVDFSFEGKYPADFLKNRPRNFPGNFLK